MLGARRRQLRLERAYFRVRGRAHRVRGARRLRRAERSLRGLRSARRRLEVGARASFVSGWRDGRRGVGVGFVGFVFNFFRIFFFRARIRIRARRRRRPSRDDASRALRDRSIGGHRVVLRGDDRMNDIRRAFYAPDPRPHRLRPRRRRRVDGGLVGRVSVPTRLCRALRRLLVALGNYLAELALRVLVLGAPRVALLLHGPRLRPERLERRAHHLGRPRGGWQLACQRVRVQRLVPETFRERVRVVEPALNVRAGELERREGHARVAGYHRRRRRGGRIPRRRRRGVLHRGEE